MPRCPGRDRVPGRSRRGGPRRQRQRRRLPRAVEGLVPRRSGGRQRRQPGLRRGLQPGDARPRRRRRGRPDQQRRGAVAGVVATPGRRAGCRGRHRGGVIGVGARTGLRSRRCRGRRRWNGRRGRGPRRRCGRHRRAALRRLRGGVGRGVASRHHVPPERRGRPHLDPRRLRRPGRGGGADRYGGRRGAHRGPRRVERAARDSDVAFGPRADPVDQRPGNRPQRALRGLRPSLRATRGPARRHGCRPGPGRRLLRGSGPAALPDAGFGRSVRPAPVRVLRGHRPVVAGHPGRVADRGGARIAGRARLRGVGGQPGPGLLPPGPSQLVAHRRAERDPRAADGGASRGPTRDPNRAAGQHRRSAQAASPAVAAAALGMGPDRGRPHRRGPSPQPPGGRPDRDAAHRPCRRAVPAPPRTVSSTAAAVGSAGGGPGRDTAGGGMADRWLGRGDGHRRSDPGPIAAAGPRRARSAPGRRRRRRSGGHSGRGGHRPRGGRTSDPTPGRPHLGDRPRPDRAPARPGRDRRSARRRGHPGRRRSLSACPRRPPGR